MARIPNLQESFFTNSSSTPVEFMIAVGESVRVTSPADTHAVYIVKSTEAEQQSVVLLPGESLELL